MGKGKQKTICGSCGKEKSECANCEIFKVAEAEKSADIVLRETEVKSLEGDMAYSRELYVNSAKVALRRTAETIIEAGRCLLVIKEKEGHGEFLKIVEDELHLNYRTAGRFMNAALKNAKYPQLKLDNVSNLSKVYALIEAPDEDLQELNDKGVMAGVSFDELQIMSVKDMRSLIKSLKTETDKIVKVEVKKLETEKDALVKQVQELEARTTPVETLEQFALVWDKAQEKVDEGVVLFGGLKFDDVSGDIAVRKKYDSKINGLESQFASMIEAMRDVIA